MKPTKTKVKCIKAATRYYEHGKEYTVYTDGSKTMYIKGSDGMFDDVTKTLSKFVRLEDEAKQQEG